MSTFTKKKNNLNSCAKLKKKFLSNSLLSNTTKKRKENYVYNCNYNEYNDTPYINNILITQLKHSKLEHKLNNKDAINKNLCLEKNLNNIGSNITTKKAEDLRKSKSFFKNKNKYFDKSKNMILDYYINKHNEYIDLNKYEEYYNLENSNKVSIISTNNNNYLKKIENLNNLNMLINQEIITGFSFNESIIKEDYDLFIKDLNKKM